MKTHILLVALILCFTSVHSQNNAIDHVKIEEDLNELIKDISENYVYLEEKNVDLKCIKSNYQKAIKNIKTEEQTVLFFEYILDEFYDNHLTLRTNRDSSYRLFAPLYATYDKNR